MKVCYLILAHNNFRHLDRLIDALNDENSFFYIHVDKKVKAGYKNILPNVKIISQRFDISWGGFNMIKATLALIDYAIDETPDADYYALISGVDYPIRSKDFFLKQLKQGKEFIDILPVPLPHKPLERFEYYYLEHDRRSPYKYNPKRILEKFLRRRMNFKRNIPFPLYAGSQWFVLTNECIRYIKDTLENDKSYIRFFKHTLIPDEAFFQTIIGNSPFKDNVTACLLYADWSVPSPPATIENRHVDFLKTHIEFNDENGTRFPYFARKFNDDSEDVLRRIREELWS